MTIKKTFLTVFSITVFFLYSTQFVMAAVTPVFDVSGGYFDDSHEDGAHIDWTVYVYGTKMYLPYTVSMNSNCNGRGVGENAYMRWYINTLSFRQYSQDISFTVPWNQLKDPIATIPVKITGIKKNKNGGFSPVILYSGTVLGPTCR